MDWIEIRSDALSAAINPYGAELSSLKDADGRELMTDADPRFWTGRAPLLFPVVGAPSGETIRIDGQAYEMKKHGFARRRAFRVAEASESRAVFVLEDDAETRALYPFAFRLTAAYTLRDAALRIDVTVANPGDLPLPASFGFHPAFAWPLPYGAAREAHRITFAKDEPDALRAIADDGTIADAAVPSPLDGRVLRLADALFAHDALVWDAVRSDRVTYGAPGTPQLEIAFPDTPKLGIWTKPGARFVCVEPWHGIADPHGFAGDFRDKPGVFTVAPGAQQHIAMSVTLLPA
jgi:galactose mutarotase-like enzyme